MPSHTYVAIISTLLDFYKKGLLNKNMVAFCSPPKKVRPARLYFLKKIHKTPMGIRPIVSSCESAKSFLVRAKLPSLDRNSETELPSDLSL